MDQFAGLVVVDMGIDTHQEPIVYMREDSDVVRAEGFAASSRVQVSAGERSLIATLNVVAANKMSRDHVGLSRIALKVLRLREGSTVTISHAPLVESLSIMRKKVYGHALNDTEIEAVVHDISAHRYTDVEIASFLAACSGNRLNIDEIIGLTRAMVTSGERLDWGRERIFDKHCIGGLPGNRTTPLVVAIASAAGLVIPKTSSRAITSPAGTADTMETLTCVELGIDDIRRVVAEAGACLAWGGAVKLSPADDVMIRIERALDIDSEGQLIASVLSKKIAAGSTHVLIDIPVGETAKVRNQADADRLSGLFTQVGTACGIYVRCVLTDGTRPVGAGIGPVEEARDILAVLQCDPAAPRDLRQRSLTLAAHLLDMAQGNGLDSALEQATELLDKGRAWEQFQRIAQAQGGLKTLADARFSQDLCAKASGVVQRIDNRKLARLAKLAGAPFDSVAGLRLHANVDAKVVKGEPLLTLYSDSQGELNYALDYYQDNAIFTLD